MKKFLSILLSMLMLLGACVPVHAEEQAEAVANENLVAWCRVYNNLLYALTSSGDTAVDTVFANGAIGVAGNEVVYGPNGVPTLSGGAYSGNGTVMLGYGTGLEGYEDHWYTSVVFNAEASSETLYYVSMAFIMASRQVGYELSEDTSAMIQEADTLLQALLSSENIAIESNGLVLVGKQVAGGLTILALDTIPYYDEFYYNDTENYFFWGE